MKDLQLKYLTDHWDEINNSTRFAGAMDNVVKGVYPHAGGVLAELMRRTAKTTPPLDTAAASSGNGGAEARSAEKAVAGLSVAVSSTQSGRAATRGLTVVR